MAVSRSSISFSSLPNSSSRGPAYWPGGRNGDGGSRGCRGSNGLRGSKSKTQPSLACERPFDDFLFRATAVSGTCSTPELLKPVLKPSDYGLACSLVSMLFEMSPKSTLFAILNLLPTSPLKPHGAPPPCLYDTTDVTKMLLSPFQPHPTKTPPDHSPDKNSSEKSRPGRSTELCDTREPKTREAIVENRPSTLTILL